ncbi:DMT family transporter [Desulfotruncus alcoholivorax]|uniref:DMT family transporter n=1 Tax=Desulfotruncus alcoholivorax TaxID=265477 RepID=UPI0003F95D01|nr:DMT family transporter [Desulfotruncus alcoholivorax]
MSFQIKGFLYVFSAAMLWGLSGPIAKYMFNTNVDPFDLVQIRLILSFFIILGYLALCNRKLLRLDREDYLYVFILGIIGVAVVQFTYLYTISATNVATAVFLEYLAPIFVLIYGVARRQEALNRINCSAIIFAALGGFLIVKGNLHGGLAVSEEGLISGLTAASSFAFYTVYTKRGLAKYSPLTIMCWSYAFGALIWLFYQQPWVTFSHYYGSTWYIILYYVVLATVLPYGLFFKGLFYLSPFKAGLTANLEPVIAAVSAYLMLGEKLTVLQFTGCGFILLAVSLIQLKFVNLNGIEKPVDDNVH